MSELTTLRSAKATDFEYVDVLGHGCAGVVLRARCKLGGLTKSYAVKIIYSYLSVTKDLIEKQRVEFELLESLSSPHVVKCWCHFEDALPASVKPLIPAETWDLMCERGAAPQTLFAVFDLYPQTLRTFRLQWGDVMPRLPFTNIAVAILNAFVFLEESNVLHRDVKDDNVMVVVEGDTTGIRLCDFGDAVRVVR